MAMASVKGELWPSPRGLLPRWGLGRDEGRAGHLYLLASPMGKPTVLPSPPHLGESVLTSGVPLLCFCADPSMRLADLEALGTFRRPLQGSCGTFFHFSSALFLNLLTIVKCLYAGLCLPPELI